MSKLKKQDKIFYIGVLIIIFCVGLFLFSIIYLKTYFKYQGKIENEKNAGCLIGPKLVGYTENITKKEFKKKMIRDLKTPESLREIVVMVLEREKERLDGAYQKFDEDYTYIGIIESASTQIACQHHLLELLDQIQEENK